MKYNLKNRPRGFLYTDRWFEGFEKELREKIKHWKDQGCEGQHMICQACSKVLAWKEILGE